MGHAAKLFCKEFNGPENYYSSTILSTFNMTGNWT